MIFDGNNCFSQFRLIRPIINFQFCCYCFGLFVNLVFSRSWCLLVIFVYVLHQKFVVIILLHLVKIRCLVSPHNDFFILLNLSDISIKFTLEFRFDFLPFFLLDIFG